MKEDIEIIEDNLELFIDTLYECYRQSAVKPFEKAIENLITGYKELEKQIQRKESIIKHLENSMAKYYEDNVSLLRKNGHIDILADNLHYKYWDDIKNYIPKSRIEEQVKELEDLEPSTFDAVIILKNLLKENENHIPRID